MNIIHLFIGFSVLLICLLALNVSRIRFKEKIGNGDGGSQNLKNAIRAHMNAIEHILPYSLLLFVMQLQEGFSVGFLFIMAAGFLIIRFFHAYAMICSKFVVRKISAGVTYFLEFFGCVLVIANNFL